MKLLIQPKIQVGAHTYSIRFNEDLKDDGDYARVNHRTQVIEINPLRPKSQIYESYIHEMLHIINNVYVDAELSERQISGISEGLAQVMLQFDIEPDLRLIK